MSFALETATRLREQQIQSVNRSQDLVVFVVHEVAAAVRGLRAKAPPMPGAVAGPLEVVTGPFTKVVGNQSDVASYLARSVRDWAEVQRNFQDAVPGCWSPTAPPHLRPGRRRRPDPLVRRDRGWSHVRWPPNRSVPLAHGTNPHPPTRRHREGPVMPSMPGTALGEFIREQRQLARLSLREMARLTSISNAYLSQVERGLHEPSVRVLHAVSDALGIPLEDLVGRTSPSRADASATGEGAGRSAVERAIRQSAGSRRNRRRR